MDLSTVWKLFVDGLSVEPPIKHVEYKQITGIPFLYIETNVFLRVQEVEILIRTHAAKAMKGKRLHSETILVRNKENLFVYRHRFFVPQQKMFCCGNLCLDCVRLKSEE
ncbi:hypothetical protein LS684_07585 [Cytobacillus spongiae]|jgi:hypothetical protein|uniref:hypothetical protein n=1 Tax=Cytobacillus spongiae TaxID=2901381 RepID=UPI001F1EA85D|nr:hypothetical protein [Cytobacillus spongiae]UII57292.1 hypothetical protein LS684_07585 [Cytobacillus spongiae]